MKTDRRTKDLPDHTPHRYPSYSSDKDTSFEDRFFTFVSLGAIVSGGLACLASVGIGMSLVLLGSMVFAEL